MSFGPSWIRLVGVLLLIVAAAPVRAAETKRAVLILVPGVDSERLFRLLDRPELRSLREGSGIALMNSSVPGADTTESAYLTLGAGQRLPCPPGLTLVSPGAFGETLQLDRTALARIRQASGRSDAFPFALGTLLKQSGIPVRYQQVGGAGPDLVGPGALCAADGEGRLEVQRFSLRSLESSGLLVLDFPAGSSPDLVLRSAQEMLPLLNPARDRLIVTSPDPYPVVNGQWMRLSPVVVWGEGNGGRWLTSATTRTPGLLSNTDLASTLLDHFQVEIPARIEGHPARPSRSGSVQELLAFAAQARANRDAMVPGLIGWGVLALVAVVLALSSLASPAPPARAAWGRSLVTATASVPSALLLTALLPTREPWQVLVLLAGFTALLASLAPRLCRGRSPLIVPYVLLLSLLLLDLYLPTTMLARNLMSDFTNVGGRFYGIGNEYLGLLLGVAIAVPCWLISNCELRIANCEVPNTERAVPSSNFQAPSSEGDRSSSSSTPAISDSSPDTKGSDLTLTPTPTPSPNSHARVPNHPHPDLSRIGVLWLLTLIGVGAPGMGADFGGAVSLALAFVYAGVTITGRRLKLRDAAVGIGIAGGVGLGLVLFDLSRPPEQRTHLGRIAARLFSGEAAAVGEMVMRKLMLNVEMALNAYFLVSMALVAPLIAFCYSRIGRNAGLALRARPVSRAGIYALLVGGIITMALNDTGVIAWALACGAALLWWLDLMLEDRYWNGSCAR